MSISMYKKTKEELHWMATGSTADADVAVCTCLHRHVKNNRTVESKSGNDNATSFFVIRKLFLRNSLNNGKINEIASSCR